MANTMYYVAADPEQPGAAWAFAVDDPRFARDTARDIAGWIKRGANVLRVDADTATEMLKKWDRTAKTSAAEKKRYFDG